MTLGAAGLEKLRPQGWSSHSLSCSRRPPLRGTLLCPSLALPMLEPEVNASSALSGNSEKWSPRLVGGLDPGKPRQLRRRRGRRHLARAHLLFQFLEMARRARAAFERGNQALLEDLPHPCGRLV